VAQDVGPEFNPQYCKNKQNAKMLTAGKVAHAVQHLLSKRKALSSIFSHQKKKKKKKR
jgi:hypothetical protein